MDLFAPCWHRVDRADEHRLDLVQIWNDHLERDPFDFSFVHEGDGIHVLHVWENIPMPPEFTIRLGEWLYHLRACLDHIVWATAAFVSGSVPPPSDSRLQYPIYDSKKAWDNNLSRLNDLAEHHREMLWTMQPFNSDPDANYLGVINTLARIDRHRRPTAGTAFLADIEPVVQAPTTSQITFQWGQRVLIDGSAEVARVTVDPWDDDVTVVMNPRIGIDPEVGEWARSSFWRPIRFGERLAMIQLFVGMEIAVYEYDCTGQSRNADGLTSSYRGECDERGRLAPPSSVLESWEWSEPVKGTVSTAARFRGDDFPAHGAAQRPRGSS